MTKFCRENFRASKAACFNNLFMTFICMKVLLVVKNNSTRLFRAAASGQESNAARLGCSRVGTA